MISRLERDLIEIDSGLGSGGPSTNRELADAILRRTVVVSHVSDRLIADLGAAYSQAARELAARMRAAFARGIGPGRFSQELRGAVANELAEVLIELNRQTRGAFDDVLRDLWDAEIETGVAIFERSIPDDVLQWVRIARPNAAVLDVANVDVLGQSLGRWYSRRLDNDLAALARELGVGALQGDDMQTMIRRVRAILQDSGRRARDVARTATQTIANEANGELFAANRDVVKGVVYEATFDRRTCPVCAGNDGRRFVGEAFDRRIRIPIHPNCRCVYTPITKSWKELGIPGAALSPASKASMNGQVPGELSFAGWLKTQPDSVANDILGKGRADLWRSGRFRLRDFQTDRTHRPIPLRTLRRRLLRSS